MIRLLLPSGVAYDTVATAEDVVRRQSKGMGTRQDVRNLEAALRRSGRVLSLASTRSFAYGTSAGSPVAVYRCELIGDEED